MTTQQRHQTPADTTQAVDAFLASLVHPMKDTVQAIRAAVLAADPAIREGVKWNAPSYRTDEYFATTHLREQSGVGVVLHRGAKVRGDAGERLAVEDPAGLLHWLAPDRAIVRFASAADFVARQAAFSALIRAWIRMT